MSKVLVLGGVGAMASETTRNLVETSDFEKITIADINIEKAEEFSATLKDNRVSVAKVDVNNITDLVKLMKGYDVVASGLPRYFGPELIKAVIEARVNYIDMTSLTPEKLALDGEAKKAGISCIGGCGTSPGVVNFLVQLGAERFDSVEQIDIDFAVLFPVGFSPALLYGIFHRFSPSAKDRLEYEDGKLVLKPPFSGAKTVNFPEPVGTQTTYFVSHGEPVTLSKNIKGVKRVYIRGCYRPEIMSLLRICNTYGILAAGPVEFEGKKIVPVEFLKHYLLSVPEGHEPKDWGVAGQVEIIGVLRGKKAMLRFVRHYPPEWSGTESLSRGTGYALSIGTQFLAQGKARKKGIDGVEAMLPAQEFMDKFEKCAFKVSEEVIEL